jgi:hypothetical protein
MRAGGLKWFVVAACAGFTPLGLQAQAAASTTTDTVDEAQYRELLHKALQEYELGHWSEAKVFFSEAHALRPNARTLRGLGQTCYESRSYVEAIGFLEQALASQVQPLTDDMRHDVEKFLGEARGFVSRLVVQLEPESAELRVDQQPAKRNPDGSMWLDPGEHLLSVQAPGYASLTRTVNADGGNEVQQRLSLQPLVLSEPPALPIALAPQALAVQPSAADVAAPNPEPPRASAAATRSIVPIVVASASGAVAVAGGVLVAIGQSDKHAVEHPAPPAQWEDAKTAYDRGSTLLPVGWALLGVGAAGVVVGLSWYFWPRESAAAAGASLSVAPGGVVLSGAM